MHLRIVANINAVWCGEFNPASSTVAASDTDCRACIGAYVAQAWSRDRAAKCIGGCGGYVTRIGARCYSCTMLYSFA